MPQAVRASAIRPTSGTRALLACGIAAGPLFMLVAVIQAFTRHGFDITRHIASLLSNGGLGWIQITDFVLAGLLSIACAAGMRRVLQAGRGRVWGPRLVGAYGAGMIAAGAFRADPANGFPPGTPAGPPAGTSWHGALHLAGAGVGFLCLIAACFVIASRTSILGQRGWAAYSRATGVIFLAGFAGVSSGATTPVAVLGFWGAVAAGWAWIALLAARLTPREPDAPVDRRNLGQLTIGEQP